MSFADYRLNAQVRAILDRWGLDRAALEHGVVNGVVYLRASLTTSETGEFPDHDPEDLLRELRRLDGVREVVVQDPVTVASPKGNQA